MVVVVMERCVLGRGLCFCLGFLGFGLCCVVAFGGWNPWCRVCLVAGVLENEDKPRQLLLGLSGMYVCNVPTSGSRWVSGLWDVGD